VKGIVDSASASEAVPAPETAEIAGTADAAGSVGSDRPSRLLEHGWWPLVLWCLGLVMGAGALSDNSFLTHLATGRLIREGGAPHTDVYSFATEGSPIVVQSWLASWWYATLEWVGGAFAIRVFIALLTATLLVVLWRLTRPAASLVGRMALVAMAAMVGLLWWNERPQIIGFLALALIALVISERRSPWWLFGLFALWVNCHGSFPLGLAYVGMAVVVRVVANRAITRREVTEAVATVAGIVIGAAVSPYGFELLTFPIELLGRSSSLILITEWRPLALREFATVVFLIEVVAICALLAMQRAWLRLLMAAFFVGLALMAVRNVAIASLALIPIAAPSLAGLGSLREGPSPGKRQLRLGGVVAAALVMVFIGVTDDYDLSAYPTAAVDWMQDAGLVGRADGENLRVLSHDYSGNYLEWRYGAEANTWIDDRAELYPFETARDYVFLLSDIGDHDVILARHPHDVVMWAADSTLARHLAADDAYEIIYRDPGTVIACRKGGAGPC